MRKKTKKGNISAYKKVLRPLLYFITVKVSTKKTKYGKKKREEVKVIKKDWRGLRIPEIRDVEVISSKKTSNITKKYSNFFGNGKLWYLESIALPLPQTNLLFSISDIFLSVLVFTIRLPS